VAGGRPIEAVEDVSTVEIPSSMIGRGEYFALEVQGESMREDGILDGDLVVVRRQSVAENGDTVVAIINNEATVKRYYHKGDHVELRPAHPDMESILIKNGEFRIQGKVVGVIRYYR
jgi:repressor LexA